MLILKFLGNIYFDEILLKHQKQQIAYNYIDKLNNTI